MITLEKFFKLVSYKIGEGSEYCWSCYGSDAFILTSEFNDEWGSSVVFDTKTQVVYEVDVHDYQNNCSYRLLNPEYRKAYFDEAVSRNIDPYEAYDEVHYVDLELEEDFLEKAQAIMEGVPYDKKILVPITLSDDEMATVERLASEHGLTPEEYLSKLIEDNAEEFIAQCRAATENLDTDSIKDESDDEANDVLVSSALANLNVATGSSFELEQQIQNCWAVTDDLQLLLEGVLDKGMSTDEISNALLGMKAMYELKFDKTFSTFEELHHNLCVAKNKLQ